jgi:uncharacterized protein YxjI
MGLFGRGLDGPTFKMRAKLFSIGDDFWIEDSDGNKVYKVDAKALRVRETFILEDANGNELFKIQEKKLAIRDTMTVERGATKVKVRKGLIGIRDHYAIDVDDGEDMKARGDFGEHEYHIERDGKKIAEVSKKWFKIRDSYGIQLASGQDVPLILAISVCVDEMASDK